jgi:hypothetical protein
MPSVTIVAGATAARCGTIIIGGATITVGIAG